MTGPDPTATPLPRPGDLIGGKYRIVRLIGDGGMGTVYEARHEVLGARVALKFVNPDLSHRPGLAQRFLQEARVSATIQSPHVTRVTDVDQGVDGAAWLVMELLSGESLQQRLDRQPPLCRDEAVDIALQVASGLEAAHAQGVVHRDLKPDNVFITPSPTGPFVKLLDFGIAKLRHETEAQRSLTRPGSVMGTPEYMAPEQAFAADQVDHRADIYSFGVIVYEMLAGVRPVESDDPQTIVEHVIHGRTTRLVDRKPDLPAGLSSLVDRMLLPSPEARPSSIREVRLSLARFAGELSRAGQLATLADDSARISQPDLSRASRPGSVPKTLPPDEPPPTAASTEPGGGGGGLAGPTPYAVTPPLASGSVAGAPVARRSRRGPKIAAALLVVGVLAGAGVWVSQNRSLFTRRQPPPLPAAPPRTTLTAEEPPPVRLDPGIDEEPAPEPPRSEPRPARRAKTAKPAPTAPATSDESRPPKLPLPSLQLPSGFPPLPSSLPTALPTELPHIPGLTLPGQSKPDEESSNEPREQPAESPQEAPRHL